jgi:tetratricopeptide (TPR) repeat protein
MEQLSNYRSLREGREMRRLPIFLMLGYLIACFCGFLEPWGTLAFGESLDDWISKGSEAYQKKQYEEATKFYSKALELDPNSDKVLFDRGLSYYMSGRWEEARSDFMKFTQFKPEAHAGFFYIGMTFLRQKDYPNALIEFDKAIAIEKRPEYYLNAARAALDKGYSGTAMRYCRDAFRLFPERRRDEKFKKVADQAREMINAEIKAELDKRPKATGFPSGYPSSTSGVQN